MKNNGTNLSAATQRERLAKLLAQKNKVKPARRL